MGNPLWFHVGHLLKALQVVGLDGHVGSALAKHGVEISSLKTQALTAKKPVASQ